MLSHTFISGECRHLGAIPDGTVGGNICGDFGPVKDVTFTVSGVTGPLTDVRVVITAGAPLHTWVGDLDVNLRAPGGTPFHTIFRQTLAATAAACGDDSDVTGPYDFFDAAPASPTFWAAATTAGGAAPVAPANYRATTTGGAAGGGTVRS